MPPKPKLQPEVVRLLELHGLIALFDGNHSEKGWIGSWDVYVNVGLWEGEEEFYYPHHQKYIACIRDGAPLDWWIQRLPYILSRRK